MKIFRDDIQELKKVSLILGFFDGIHLGHVEVIKSAVDYAKLNDTRTVLLTFQESPLLHFGKKNKYIYPRKISYELMSKLGVDYIIEKDFTTVARISAEEYLSYLVEFYRPISISTGINHRFGFNKTGNAKFLEENSINYGYKYFSIPSYEVNGEIASSTVVKNYLMKGQIEKANKILSSPFVLESKVIHGAKLGREIGFPTANMKYPEKIVRIPYGVYAVRVNGLSAVLNWGVKPSVGEHEELLELHIPNFNEDLYNQIITVEVVKKIREEKCFDSLLELKKQISEDIEKCLKL